MTLPDKNKTFNVVLVGGIFTIFLLMLLYSYQGWFTRYMADDYCNAVMFRDPINGLYNRYMTGFGGNRYSNIWLVGISELFGGSMSISVFPGLHIMFWLAGLNWTLTEIKKLLRVNWSLWMTVFMALVIMFFTFIQTPNIYQSIYWRSSMTTHFAPIVYGTLLTAYLLSWANRAAEQDIPVYSRIIVFISAFVIGGFSEPADAIQITVLTLAIAAVWYWGASPARERMLKLLSWALAGAVISLVVMAVSPANFRRLGTDPHTPMQILGDSVSYGFIFINKTLAELPLPTILSILLPALLMAISTGAELTQKQKRTLWVLVVATPLLAFLLMVASFSPSALGQGYPVARMQLYARLLMTLALLVDGALLGILFSKNLARPLLQWGMLALLLALAVAYPARVVMRIYNEIPEYRARAEAWDERAAHIQNLKEKGTLLQNVTQFDGVYGTKELDTYATHWVNRCAAKYFGIRGIRAVPPGE